MPSSLLFPNIGAVLSTCSFCSSSTSTVSLWLQPLSGLGTRGGQQSEIVLVLHFHPELGVL